MSLSPEVCVTESHLDGVEVLVVLGGTNMDWVLRGPEVTLCGAVDGDVGARVVEDPVEPERERAHVAVAEASKIEWVSNFPTFRDIIGSNLEGVEIHWMLWFCPPTRTVWFKA